MIRLHLFQVNFSLLESYFSLCKSFYIKVKGKKERDLLVATYSIDTGFDISFATQSHGTRE